MMNGKEMIQIVEKVFDKHQEYTCITVTFSKYRPDEGVRVGASLYTESKAHSRVVKTDDGLRAIADSYLDQGEPLATDEAVI